MHRQPRGASDACVVLQRWFRSQASQSSAPRYCYNRRNQRRWLSPRARCFSLSARHAEQSGSLSNSKHVTAIRQPVQGQLGQRFEAVPKSQALQYHDIFDKQLEELESSRASDHNLLAPRTVSAGSIDRLLEGAGIAGQEQSNKKESFVEHTLRQSRTLSAHGQDATNQTGQVTAADSTSGFRDLLSRLTYPVVVLTARESDRQTTDRTDYDGMHGVTLSSFATVTMQPEPYISFNISERSRTIAAILKQKSPRICIHLLNGTEDGVRIAHSFTQKYDRPEEPFERLADQGATITEIQAAPRIQHNGGVLAWLNCSSDGNCILRTVGDHHICLFRVDKWILAQHSQKQLPDTSSALGYYNRKYTKASHIIIPRRHLHSTTASFSRAGKDELPTSSRQSSPTQLEDATEDPFVADDTAQLPPQQVPDHVMKQPLEDFLAHVEGDRVRHLKRVIQFSKQAHLASEELQAKKEAGTLEETQRQALENIITDRNRFVARRLALQAVDDLQRMLDSGHVSHSRVQYLEKCIERGVAVLLAEARDLQYALERWGPDAETVWVNRTRLLDEENRLQTALHRLREYADEEDGSDFYDD